MAERDANRAPGGDEPRPAAVIFVTTDNSPSSARGPPPFAESTGRSTMFLGALSGGLVALAPAVVLCSAVGLVAARVSHHLLAAAIVAGVLGAGATLTALINVQSSTWRREATRMVAES